MRDHDKTGRRVPGQAVAEGVSDPVRYRGVLRTLHSTHNLPSSLMIAASRHLRGFRVLSHTLWDATRDDKDEPH